MVLKVRDGHPPGGAEVSQQHISSSTNNCNFLLIYSITRGKFHKFIISFSFSFGGGLHGGLTEAILCDLNPGFVQAGQYHYLWSLFN